jgi:hypothetical protein
VSQSGGPESELFAAGAKLRIRHAQTSQGRILQDGTTSYQTAQNVGGFFGARVKSIAEYLPLKAGNRVIDTG